MASKFSEYSRLRSIARKRAERLSEVGLSSLMTFPTVKELKAQGINAAQAVKSIESYLAAPTKTREYRKIDEAQRPVFIPTASGVLVTSKEKEKQERRKEQNRQSSRRYRERIQSLSKKDRSYIKTARTLGLHITPANAKAFTEYMEFRFAQGSDSVFYRVARYVEDYISLIAKKVHSPQDILKDFNEFLIDRMRLQGRADSMNGITPEELDNLMEDFIES